MPKLATYRARLSAYILDIMLLVALRQLIQILNLPDFAWGQNEIIITERWIFILVMFAYLCLVPLMTNGQTIGKAIFGIRIVSTNNDSLNLWRLFIRNWIGYIASAFVMGIGFLWALSDRNHQTWHDVMANTIVIQA